MAKVLVSMDEALLARVDEAARDAGLSRSAYLAQLATRDLGEERGPGASPRVHAALRRIDELVRSNPTPAEDSTDAIRAERDAR